MKCNQISKFPKITHDINSGPTYQKISVNLMIRVLNNCCCCSVARACLTPCNTMVDIVNAYYTENRFYV